MRLVISLTAYALLGAGVGLGVVAISAVIEWLWGTLGTVAGTVAACGLAAVILGLIVALLDRRGF